MKKGTEWPHTFSEMEGDIGLLKTDSLQVALSSDDIYLQTKLKAILKANLIAEPISNGESSHLNNSLENATKIEGINGELKTELEEAYEAKAEQVDFKTDSSEINKSDQVPSVDSKLEVKANSDTQENGSAQADSGTLVPVPTTVASSTPSSSVSYQHHKTTLNQFSKPGYQSYRHNSVHNAAALAASNSYLYAAQNHAAQFNPYGSIQLQQARQIQAAAALNPFYQQAGSAMPGVGQLQQQVFLCRTPNGLAYVTAANPNMVGAAAAQQQLAAAQAQAQANALYQQQAAAIAQVAAMQGQAASSYAAAPTSYQTKLPNTPNSYSAQAAQAPQHQIIYQAAPQPASAVANKVIYLFKKILFNLL